MKAKYALILILISWGVDIVGALFKIMHWPYADVMLMLGTVLYMVGFAWLIYKLFKYEKVKEFLNS